MRLRMTNIKQFFLLTAVAFCAYLTQSAVVAKEIASESYAVGAASISAPVYSLKVDLERQFSESQSLKPASLAPKYSPEPVCRERRDLDKTLILGGAEILPM